MPPASPAAITACMSDASILRASSAAQLTGGDGGAMVVSESAESIASCASGAYQAAMRKQPMVPP